MKAHHGAWSYIPFSAREARSKLKRRYGVCGRKEMDELGIKAEDRRGGLPSIVLVRPDGEAATVEGVKDVQGLGKEALLDKWRALLSKAEAGPAKEFVGGACKRDGTGC